MAKARAALVLRSFLIAAVVVVPFGFMPSSAEAGVLGKVRNRAGHRSGRPAKPSRTRNRDRQPDRGSRRDSNRVPRTAPLYPWIAGFGTGLLLYPYARPVPRTVSRPTLRASQETAPTETSDGRQFGVQLSASGGLAFANNGDGEIDRYNARLRLQTPWGIDVSTAGAMLVETLPKGTARLALWKATAWLRVFDGESAQLAIGAGYRRLFDPADAVNGGHVSGSLRLFPLKPFIFEGRVDAGSVGDAAQLDWLVSAGVLLGPLELFLAASGLSFDDVTLSGPSVGLRLWI
ncbi:MAG: hypothetical protein AAFP04_09455 [Myxococcota bacterium]